MSKRALLVGCNYPGTNAALRGCVNDVRSMFAMLRDCYGFEPGSMICLIDEDPNAPAAKLPTGANIKNNLKQLVAASQPGDVLFFHFSGHGTQVADKDGGEADNKDEAIVPTDMNLICDDDLREIFSTLSPEVKFTMVSDCCHSGSMLDHPEQQISGDKNPNAPAGVSGMDPGALMGMFFKGIPSGVVDDNKNRDLPQSLFCKLLGDKMGGESVVPGQIHKMMQRQFGSDASAKSIKYLGMAQAFLKSQAAGGGQHAQAAGILSKILGMCMSATPTQGGGDSAGGATTGAHGEFVPPGATGDGGAAAPGVGGEAKVACGVLITGCQAHETSADACPSGDPSKAFGALTNALTTTVKATKSQDPGANIACKDLVHDVREVLLKSKFTQNPCLECQDKDVESSFIC